MPVPAMYLISASICLGILYLVYVAFFRFTTFFKMNRYYLVGSLLFSFVAPAVDLPLGGSEYQIFLTDQLATSLPSEEHGSIITGPMSFSPTPEQRYSALSVVYYVGAIVMLFRVCYSIRRIVKIKNEAESSYEGNFRIFRTDLPHPFSFLKFIFIPKYQIDPAIIEHEKVHIRQFHAIDLIIIEVAAIILWFNPIVFFYRRSVKVQHEYLADTYTISNGVQIEHYLKVLLHQIQVENSIGAISHFYSKSIKNRIVMITKNKTSIPFYGLYLLLIPVVCLLLLAFSNKPDRVPFIARDAVPGEGALTIIVDPGHGGSEAGAETAAGLAEKNLTLSIATKLGEIGKQNGVNVILTRADDETLTLAERTFVSEQFPAKVFISLHLNNHADDSFRSGIECFVSKSNIGFEESKEFSDHLLDELKALKGIRINGVVNSDFYVLKRNSIPAVMLQLGYLSNESDRAFITKDENQTAVAEMIIAASLKHLK